MFQPKNIIYILVFLYSTLPMIGFGIFPDYFYFEASAESSTTLATYITILITCTSLGALTYRKLNIKKRSKPAEAGLLKLGTLQSHKKTKIFIGLATAVTCTSFLLLTSYTGILNTDFTPHELRMAASRHSNGLIVILYNALTSFCLILFNINLIAIQRAKSKAIFYFFAASLILTMIASGTRSVLLFSAFSYLFILSIHKKISISKLIFTIILFLTLVFTLGALRSGNEFNSAAFAWELSARFDMFFPQFFNFLEKYENLPDIGWGYYHLTYPAQIIPSTILEEKPATFLHYINREMMHTAENTGNDYSSFAEFIYNYGTIAGAIVYSLYCFLSSFIIEHVYQESKTNAIYFPIYPIALLTYISMVLLTGLSNQAHLISIPLIIAGILLSKLFINYTKKSKKTYNTNDYS